MKRKYGIDARILGRWRHGSTELKSDVEEIFLGSVMGTFSARVLLIA